MSFIKNLVRTKQTKHPYLKFFFEDQDRDGHPLQLALNSYEALINSADNQQELFLYLIEDILTSSLSATFYEELLKTVRENPSLTDALIESFSQDQDLRDSTIAVQAQHHLDFLLNDGNCAGCPVCNNHADVEDLLPQLKAANLSFFKGLYIGMQTIQFAMEEFIYDLIPETPGWIDKLNENSVLEIRKEIFEFVQKNVR